MPDHLAENRRRIEEWRRTGDLAALWPDIAAGELHAAHAQIRAVTEVMLGPSATRPSLAAADERQCRTLGIAGFMSGMGPLLGWWIEQGRIDAPHGAREILAHHLDHGRRRNARLRGDLVRIVQAMRVQGVDPIVLKGLHVGADYFPDPGTRPAADIDLLVPPTERARAVVALTAAGLVESRRTKYAARSEWVPASAPRQVHSLEVDHADAPWSVDLHTALERWYFRGLRRGLGEELPHYTTSVTIGRDSVRVLAQPYLAAFLAMHASNELVKVRMVRVVELALLARTDVARGRLDWDEFTYLLYRTKTERFVYPALALVEDLVPGTVPGALLVRLARGATNRTKRVIAAVQAAGMAPLTHRSLDAKLMWASGPKEMLLNMSELLLPSDDGMPLGPLQLQWQRLRALWRGSAGWRAR